MCDGVVGFASCTRVVELDNGRGGEAVPSDVPNRRCASYTVH